MNRMTMLVGMMLVTVAAVLLAEDVTSPRNFKSDVNFDNGCVWKIKGTQVTATADNLNSGVASSTASLVSNQLLQVYGSNMLMTGTATLGTEVVTNTLRVVGASTLQSTANIAGAVTCSNTLSVAGATTLTGGLAPAGGYVVTNTFAAGVYTQRIFYAVGGVVTNTTILP